MNSTLIPNHVQQALDRLLTQYKEKPNIAGILTAFVEQIQDLEDVTFSLDYGRSVYGAVGVQLDLLGTIVNELRNGLEDDQYRLFILGKIGENSSNATAAAVAAVFGAILGSPLVQEQDLYPAAVGLSAQGSLDPSLINIVYELVQLSLGAGIRLEFLSVFEEGDAFAFAGPLNDALGFGTTADPSVGGKFAGLLEPNFPFAFASNDPFDGYLGFGSTLDPFMGGNFQGL